MIFLFITAAILSSFFLFLIPSPKGIKDHNKIPEDVQFYRDILWDLMTSEDVDLPEPINKKEYRHLDIIEIGRTPKGQPWVKIYDCSRKRTFHTFISKKHIRPIVVQAPWGEVDLTWKIQEPVWVLGFEGIRDVLDEHWIHPSTKYAQSNWLKWAELGLRSSEVEVSEKVRSRETFTGTLANVPTKMRGINAA